MQVGCAVGGRLPEVLTSNERELLLRHFGVLTPENCMKPGPIHPTPDSFHFEEADRLVAFADAYGLRVIGHCLAWHQQCPDWFYAGSRGEALTRLESHISTVAGRYRGQIAGLGRGQRGDRRPR